MLKKDSKCSQAHYLMLNIFSKEVVYVIYIIHSFYWQSLISSVHYKRYVCVYIQYTIKQNIVEKDVIVEINIIMLHVWKGKLKKSKWNYSGVKTWVEKWKWLFRVRSDKDEFETNGLTSQLIFLSSFCHYTVP